jgi:hypothetical protein
LFVRPESLYRYQFSHTLTLQPFRDLSRQAREGNSRLHALSGLVDDCNQHAPGTLFRQWPVRGSSLSAVTRMVVTEVTSAHGSGELSPGQPYHRRG